MNRTSNFYVAAAIGLAVVCGPAGLEAAALSSAKHEQRIASHQRAKKEGLFSFEELYGKLKEDLSHNFGMEAGVDISYTFERISPNGKQMAIQGVYYPYLSWTMFQNSALGQGQLNVNYNLVRYWGTPGTVLQNRGQVVGAFNDNISNGDTFSQLSYTHTLPGKMDWLSVTVGQFPLYNFDGTEFTSNQQTALMNYSLSQNASAAYPGASLGAYVQAQNERWNVTAGYQDAHNMSGEQIRGESAFDGKYTAFSSIQWTPSFAWGQGQYGMLYYYQPAVPEQDENVHGWSVNVQQNIGAKTAVFARANGSSGGAVPIKNSYVLGAAWLNPLGRNAQDALTLGLAYNRLSDKALGYPAGLRDSETVLELQWVWGIGRFVTLTPDLQIYPKAAAGERHGLTTVIGLRTTVML